MIKWKIGFVVLSFILFACSSGEDSGNSGSSNSGSSNSGSSNSGSSNSEQPLNLACSSSSSSATQGSPTYYVDASAQTSGDGSSLQSPFKTIQECAAIMKPGDTCSIRKGIYREEITPTNSGTVDKPITFISYNNEEVVVTGLDRLSVTWASHQGSIWKTSLNSSLEQGKNQVFLDDQVQMDARWPNMANSTTFLKRDDYANSASGQLRSSEGDVRTGRYSHSGMPSWANGAKISFSPGHEWWGFVGEVTSKDGTQIDFTYNAKQQWIEFATPAADDPFMLWGKLEALDASKEFFIDNATHTLYVHGDPSGKKLEVKTRDRLLNLENKKHITIKGLRFHVGTITSNENSSYLILDEIHSEFGSYNMWKSPYQPAILLKGDHNQLINSYLATTGAESLQVRDGSSVTIRNNVIHRGGYNIQASSGVETTNLYESCIESNTIFAQQHMGISFSGLKKSKLSHNHVFGIGYQLTDIAAINSWNGGDGEGTEVSYNLVHDVVAYAKTETKHNGGAGIRIDSGKSTKGNCNFKIHHNLVFETSKAGLGIWGMTDEQFKNCNSDNYKNKDTGNRAYHNTIHGFALLDFDDLSGTEFKNNLVTGQYDGNVTDVKQEATNVDVSLINFVDSDNRNYRLLSTSSAIDSGVKLGDFNKNFKGSLPDRGAFEFGETPWVAGAVISSDNLSALTLSCDIILKSCDVSNLPVGRKLPADFKILVADIDVSSVCHQKVDDLINGVIKASCKIDLSSVTSTAEEDLYVKIGSSSAVKVGKIDLNKTPKVTSISPTGNVSKNQTLTITGKNFVAMTGNYTQNILIQNPAKALFDYQVPVTIDTATLISQGKLKSDCSDLRFTQDSSELKYWLDTDKTCNKNSTTIWLRVLKLKVGENKITMDYGNSNLSSASSCKDTFYFCDEFSDNALAKHYTAMINDNFTENNGEIRIHSTNNNDKKNELHGFRVTHELDVPSSLSYSFDAEVKFENLDNASNWKASFGGFEDTLAVYNGGTVIGYYDGSVQNFGTSQLGNKPTGWHTLGTAINADADQIYFLENNQVVGTRSNYTKKLDHRWGFAAQKDNASWEIRVDNLRIRNFVFMSESSKLTISQTEEKAVTKPLAVTINGKACLNINVISTTKLECNLPEAITNLSLSNVVVTGN